MHDEQTQTQHTHTFVHIHICSCYITHIFTSLWDNVRSMNQCLHDLASWYKVVLEEMMFQQQQQLLNMVQLEGSH